jgi:hypothetical protein
MTGKQGDSDMKTIRFLFAIVAVLGFSTGVWAQEKPMVTITGSVAARTQLNLDDGTGYANLYSGPGGETYIRFAGQLDPYSNLVFKLGAPYVDDQSGTAYNSTTTTNIGNENATNSWVSGVGIMEAWGSVDILGELGMNQMIGLKLKTGMFHLKAPVFSHGMNFGLGTGEEGSRSEVYDLYSASYPGSLYEAYKWSVEIPFNFLKDSFPLSFRVGTDLDLTGHKQKTGFTGYAEASGRNLYVLDDRFVVDWAVYTTLKARDAAPAGTPYITGGNIYGGLISVGFGFENGPSFGLGAQADWAVYDYDALWGSSTTLKSYSENNLNWQVGADMTLKNWGKVAGAYVHRNAFNLDIAKPIYDYAQNYVAARLDVQVVPKVTPYWGGTYVIDNKTVSNHGTPPEAADELSWEAGVMWTLTPSFEIDGGYTRGENGALATYGAVINAIEQSKLGAVFFKTRWKF